MATVITGSEGIQAYQDKVRLSALGLELKGLKRRGRSAYSIIKEVYGFKGSKQKVYDQFEKYIKDKYGA